MRDTIVCVRS